MSQPAQNATPGIKVTADEFVKLMRLMPISEKALRVAMQLQQIDGVGGILTVKIPEKLSAPLELACTVGRVELSFR